MATLQPRAFAHGGELLYEVDLERRCVSSCELTKLHKKAHTACLCYWVSWHFMGPILRCLCYCAVMSFVAKTLIQRVFAIRFFETWMSQIALA